MDRKLILVVDRDNDFGVKADVVTPVIGVDACMKAAAALAVADPEDSDSNALYAAISMYNKMKADRAAPDVEVALICGDRNVGYRSDEALTEELGIVLDSCKPKGVLLVSDGAEDEYIYPIISSRIHIDSVRKVYVKQAPGVEGTLYILSKYMKDPDKKRRFGSPIAFGIIAISLLFLISNFFVYDTMKDLLFHSTTIFIGLIIGVLLLCYSFSIYTKIDELLVSIHDSPNKGAIMLFVVLAILSLVFGIIVAIYALDDTYTTRLTEKVILFVANLTWPVVFALMLLNFGFVATQYLSNKTIRFRNIAASLYIASAGLLITAFLDYFMEYTQMYG